MFERYTKINEPEWKLMLGVGVLIFLSGLLILILPEILVAFFAGIFFISGITLIAGAWKIRKMSNYRHETIPIRWFD